MQRQNTYGATRITGQRPQNTVPCPRCGIEIQYRKDRQNQMCGDCRSVVRNQRAGQ